MPPKPRFLDTTLRDGEQTPGVNLTPDDKMSIAAALDSLGVDVIEAGSAPVSDGERSAIRAIAKAGLRAEICSYTRAVKADIDHALSCDVDSIHLVVPLSDLHITQKLKKTRPQVLEASLDAARYAKDHGLQVEYSAEDASRADFQFLSDAYRAAAQVPVDRICFCDTVGVLQPRKVEEIFQALRALGPPAAFHGHNDFGLGTANSVAALLSGAAQAHVTINGLGERAGNASLEEVVLVLERLHGIPTSIRKEKLYEVSKLVSRLTKMPVGLSKPVVGENAFTHGSGIHIHGMRADPATYEPIPPELVGRTRRFVFGKHTGKAGIEISLQELGLRARPEQVDEITRRVKELGDKGFKVTDADLKAIIDSVLQVGAEPKVKLKELSVVSGNHMTPTASITLQVNGREVVEAATGVGPVDAAINAIRKAMAGAKDIELVEYHVDSVTGGTNAVVLVIVKMARGDKVITAQGAREDIIMASVEAVLAGINRLL
ncbi:MAG: 2-isopropylmalate synthase [Euryarchaeota archaeon]|nr:2-isopropylmalate synthase [Euryarchaeota archaeon]